MVALGGHAWLLWGGCAWLLGGAWLLRGVCVVAPGGMHGCSGGMCGCSRGACMVALGGMRGCSRGACVVAPGGACMVAPGGGMHGCSGGHAWLLRGACMVLFGGAWVVLFRGGVRGFFSIFGYNEIRPMSGRYASYWNAFLFQVFSHHIGTKMGFGFSLNFSQVL